MGSETPSLVTMHQAPGASCSIPYYPGLDSCPFYAIPIYPFEFMKFFISLYMYIIREYGSILYMGIAMVFCPTFGQWCKSGPMFFRFFFSR